MFVEAVVEEDDVVGGGVFGLEVAGEAVLWGDVVAGRSVEVCVVVEAVGNNGGAAAAEVFDAGLVGAGEGGAGGLFDDGAVAFLFLAGSDEEAGIEEGELGVGGGGGAEEVDRLHGDIMVQAVGGRAGRRGGCVGGPDFWAADGRRFTRISDSLGGGCGGGRVYSE